MENNLKLDEYLFIEDIQDLFSIKSATTTSWGVKFSYKNEPDENSIFIFALMNTVIKRLVFNKSDLKNIRKIYKIIKIYNGHLYVNLICNKDDNKDNILGKIIKLPNIKDIILNKLNFNQYPLNKLFINKWEVIEDNFDEIYQLEFRDPNKNDKNDNNDNKDKVNIKQKPKTGITTGLVLENNNKYFNIKSKVIYNANNYKDDFNYNANLAKLLNNQIIDKNQINLKNNLMLMNNNSDQLIINNRNCNNPLIQQFQEQNNVMVKIPKFQNNFNPNSAPNQFNLMQANNNINKNNINNNPNNLNNKNNQNNFNQNKNNPNNFNQINNNQNNFNQNNFNQINNNQNNFNQNNFNQNNFNNNNNNQFKNICIMINYDEEIEKTANKCFKYIFFDGYEKDYFPKKGLNNVGLTCYMNSTLQCLLHVPEFNHYFTNCYNEFAKEHNNMIQKTETKGRISKEYYNLLKEVLINSRFSGKAFPPKAFNDLISKLNPQFSKYESNDAKDLIIYLFQEMHEELNYFGGKKLQKIPKCNQLIESDAFNFFYEINSKMNFSIISYLFWGIVKQTTTCKGCKNNFYNYQYYQYVSFPFYNYAGKKFNLYQGLKDYVSEETLSGDNQFYCQKCKCLSDAKLFSKIYYPAPYLLINFDYGKNKIYRPNSIDFGSTIFLDKTFLDNNIPDVSYELIAVSTHIGDSGNTGHYITYCKDILSQDWYKFNDSMVTQSSFEETKNNSPYLLLFKKSNK